MAHMIWYSENMKEKNTQRPKLSKNTVCILVQMLIFIWTKGDEILMLVMQINETFITV